MIRDAPGHSGATNGASSRPEGRLLADSTSPIGSRGYFFLAWLCATVTVPVSVDWFPAASVAVTLIV